MQRAMRLSRATLALGVLILGASLTPVAARAQASGVIDLSGGLPLWEPGHAVTTSIKDALPVVTYLKGYIGREPLPIPDNWVFPPGYYRSVIRSYCLHAGAYGPTKGDGYIIAPLKGDRASMLRNILLRSQQNPQIEQNDVQRLIWGVEDGARWDQYEPEYKKRIAPLLSAAELTILNLEPKRAVAADAIKRRIGGLIPGSVKNVVDTYAEMRNHITSITNFAELEKLAVKTGEAPWGKDSRKEVAESPWAYVGDGFYIRAFPSGYPTTTLEVYRVAPAALTKDAKGRITRFDSDGYIIDTTYADEAANETIDGKSVPVWRFKSIVFRHPDGRMFTIENAGYVVASVPAGFQVAALGRVPLRLQGDLGDMQHYQDGLNKAANPTDLKDKADWINDHLNRVSSAFDQANGALSGQNLPSDNKPKKLDPTPLTASPANTSKQRLALSGFKK